MTTVHAYRPASGVQISFSTDGALVVAFDPAKVAMADDRGQAPASQSGLTQPPPAPIVPGVSEPVGNWSREVQFINGDLQPLTIPPAGQEIGLRGIKQGPPMSFGPFRVDAMPNGSGSVRLAEFGGGEIVGQLAIATAAGVFVGPDVAVVLEPQTAPGILFHVGPAPAGGGYGPELLAGRDYYITVGFAAGTSAPTAILQLHPPLM